MFRLQKMGRNDIKQVRKILLYIIGLVHQNDVVLERTTASNMTVLEKSTFGHFLFRFIQYKLMVLFNLSHNMPSWKSVFGFIMQGVEINKRVLSA